MKPDHWDVVYKTKSETEVSWFQENPARSLELITEMNLDFDDPILDVGAGESHLVDCLLNKGFTNISILDISNTALQKVKFRLAEKAKLVQFYAVNVIRFNPPEKYSLWHDRATFHFLTEAQDIQTYLDIANRSLKPGGYMIVSTFSKSGPDHCSGLPVTQYSETDLKSQFAKNFTNIRCFEETHSTPWGTRQNFVYCGFKKR